MKMSKKEAIYVVGCLLMALLMLGTVGALESNIITFSVGCWQLGGAIVGGMICTYGIWLEETRAARKRR